MFVRNFWCKKYFIVLETIFLFNFNFSLLDIYIYILKYTIIFTVHLPFSITIHQLRYSLKIKLFNQFYSPSVEKFPYRNVIWHEISTLNRIGLIVTLVIITQSILILQFETSHLYFWNICICTFWDQNNHICEALYRQTQSA